MSFKPEEWQQNINEGFAGDPIIYSYNFSGSRKKACWLIKIDNIEHFVMWCLKPKRFAISNLQRVTWYPVRLDVTKGVLNATRIHLWMFVSLAC